MPFSHDAFLDVFGAYNSRFWPAALLLWVITAGLAARWLGASQLSGPRLPLFAVPCPTTLVTAGFLFGTAGVPRVLALLPLLWAVIGSSAAFALGIKADLALIVAAAALATRVIRPLTAARP